MRTIPAHAIQVLIAAGAAYVLVTAVAYVVADSVIFQPPPASYSELDGMIFLETSTGERIAAVYLPNDTARFVVLHSHGNAEDIGQLIPVFRALRAEGFAVLGYDYPGYGASEGRPSTAGATRAIEAAYDHLVRDRGAPPDRIIAYGRSVGTGPTLELAGSRPVAGVVLESGFTSAYRVLTRVPLLAFDRFPNLRRASELERPMLVVHGTDDRIVPFSHGRALYDAARGPKQRLWIEGAGHNDLLLVAGERWLEALRRFRDVLP